MQIKNATERLLKALGGDKNISANGLCATRLRVVVHNQNLVDIDAIGDIPGVLGTIQRGTKAIEVVFGPGLVNKMFEELSAQTGLDQSSLDLAAMGEANSIAMKVQINPGKKRSFAIQSQNFRDRTQRTGVAPKNEEKEELAQLLEAIPGKSSHSQQARLTAPKLLVINGPNINMLGIREPGMYGTQSYADLLSLCHEAALASGFSSCRCIQSNHEGDLVDAIQDAYGTFSAIVINPGAYTHTSIALLDALKAVNIPTVEVHISKVSEREDFRQISYIRTACLHTIQGEGIDGYRSAIAILAKHLGCDKNT